MLACGAQLQEFPASWDHAIGYCNCRFIAMEVKGLFVTLSPSPVLVQGDKGCSGKSWCCWHTKVSGMVPSGVSCSLLLSLWLHAMSCLQKAAPPLLLCCLPPGRLVILLFCLEGNKKSLSSDGGQPVRRSPLVCLELRACLLPLSLFTHTVLLLPLLLHAPSAALHTSSASCQV